MSTLQELVAIAEDWKKDRLKGCKCTKPGPYGVNDECPIHGTDGHDDHDELDESVTTKENEAERRQQFIDKIESYFGTLESIVYSKMTTADLRKMYNTLISDNLIKPLKEQLMTEGFMDFSVGGSDNAFDAYYSAIEAAEKSLRKSLKEKGNEYNTHGTLNVAMILVEKFANQVKDSAGFQDFAREVLATLNAEIAKEKEKNKANNRASGDYQEAMVRFAKRLAALTK